MDLHLCLFAFVVDTLVGLWRVSKNIYLGALGSPKAKAGRVAGCLSGLHLPRREIPGHDAAPDPVRGSWPGPSGDPQVMFRPQNSRLCLAPT